MFILFDGSDTCIYNTRLGKARIQIPKLHSTPLRKVNPCFDLYRCSLCMKMHKNGLYMCFY